MRSKLKKPEDYDQFAFRCEKKIKTQIFSEVEKVRKILNKGLSEDERVIKKNELIIAAIFEGLKAIKKKRKLS